MQELSFEPLTPTKFLERAAFVFGDRVAVVDGGTRSTYGEFWERARRLAGALRSLGVRPGERVAVLAPNTRLLLEAHYGVPMAGGVIVALNVRLSPEELAYIVDHSGAGAMLYDGELEPTARKVSELVPGDLRLVDSTEYETLLDEATPLLLPVGDERDLLSVNYTSGTTGQPKGVMYHHRGAYLQALAMAFHGRLDPATVFLWTLPMFHCNGWCFTWAVTAAGGRHLCLPKVEPEIIWRSIREEGVTHFNAAPTVLISIANHPAAEQGPAPRPIRVCTGGAPPSPTLLARMAELNMEVVHLYGLTETYGPITVCEWRPEWDELPLEQQARIKARQGVGNVVAEQMRVVDDRGNDAPADGETMGEVALRGNDLMLGYFRDHEATAAAVPDGWFRTGDIAVMHPDGYVELRDRAKDVVISGGENIASIEVEQAVMSHPAVLEAAVIAHPDEKWGEVPAAYVTLKEGHSVTEEEIVEHVRGRLAHFKAPKSVTFGPLPKTSTGKIQKFVLREAAWEGHDKRIH
ncbi:MAG: AMP-binding protein [Actinobacteria bacterium]|nr:AMP-binding protein [Actinomycetota bacterium]